MDENELRGAIVTLRDVAADLGGWKRTALIQSNESEQKGEVAIARERRHDAIAYDRVAMMLENRAYSMENLLRSKIAVREEGRRIAQRRNRVGDLQRETPEFPEINSWRQTNETER